MVLHGGETGPAVRIGRDLQVVQLVAVHGRGPQRPHRTCTHQCVQCLHRLLDGRAVVEAVDDVQVQVVRPQALQGARDLPLDGLAGQPPLVEVDLGGQDHVLAPDPQVPQGGADELLARAVGVDIGGVDEGHAELKRPLDDRLRGLLVHHPLLEVGEDPPEAHPAEAQAGDADVGVPEGRVLHTSSLEAPRRQLDSPAVRCACGAGSTLLRSRARVQAPRPARATGRPGDGTPPALWREALLMGDDGADPCFPQAAPPGLTPTRWCPGACSCSPAPPG